MHICIVNNSKIPALKYGGTERVIWWLGKALVKMGHRVSYIVAAGSSCPFADVIIYKDDVLFNSLLPLNVDVVHLHHAVNEDPAQPHIVTVHGNINQQYPLDINTVFVSANHAERFGSTSYVYNGIDPEDYGMPLLTNKRKYCHFLGDAAWRVKNVRGAISIARKAGIPLKVGGGYRFNFNMGLRLTLDPNASFKGMVGGAEKNKLMNGSKALLFPVLWNEPFGLAVIESMYFGCPVIATPYGSLPELVPPGLGFLSAKKEELVTALKNADQFDNTNCHEYVMDNFTANQMAVNYLLLYEKVMNGESLNTKSPQLVKVQQEKFLPFG